jgi:hypothetical protein
MTHFTGSAIALLVAGLTVGPQAQQHEGHQAMHGVGGKVTLSACVERGQKDDTFVLTHVADVPVHPATHGRVVYWLNDVKPLRAHVGHQIRVMGTVTDVKQEEMEVTLGDDGAGGWSVEIEGPGRDVRTTPGNAGVATGGRQSGKDDIKTTLVKLKVDEVAMVAATCPAK